MLCQKDDFMKNRVRIWIAKFIALSFVVIAPHLHAQQDTIKLGIAPHSSARFILNLYQPLRIHLEKSLGKPVEVVTAPNFSDFIRRAINQDYDIVVTTGNQTRLLQTDAGYKPFLTYQADFRSIAVVAANSDIYRAKDLAGRKFLGLNPASLVTQWGINWQKENRLDEKTIRYVSASDSVAQLLLAGDASVGFISLTNFEQLPVEVQKQLRILEKSPSMAGRVYSLNQRLLPSKNKIESALWSFAKSPEGRQYFDKYKLKGYRKLKPKELESMDRYVIDLRIALGLPK